MNEVENLAEEKVRAFKGDALLCFFARELIIGNSSYWDRMRHQSITNKMISNENLSKVSIKLQLFPTFAPMKSYDHRTLGTKYEAMLYDIYVSDGFDAAFDFFKRTVYQEYLNSRTPPTHQ